MRIFLSFLFMVMLAAAAEANDAPAPKAKTPPRATLPEPPPPPENYHPPAAPETSGGDEPSVTITTKGTEIHEEHRLNGRLYMIKVIPKKGKPYYLIDPDGSGQFRRSELETRISVPMWVIKRF